MWVCRVRKTMSICRAARQLLHLKEKSDVSELSLRRCAQRYYLIRPSKNPTLSPNTGAFPRNGFDSAIATFSCVSPG